MKLILVVGLLFFSILALAQETHYFPIEYSRKWPNGILELQYTLMCHTNESGDTLCFNRTGLYKRWHSGGLLAEEAYYSKTEPFNKVGIRKVWYENGQLGGIGQYIKYDTISIFDEKENASHPEYQIFVNYKRYHENGLRKYKFHWNKKLTCAIDFAYWENGKIKIKGYRKPPYIGNDDGFRKTGRWIFFDIKGKWQKKMLYSSKGKLIKTINKKQRGMNAT